MGPGTLEVDMVMVERALSRVIKHFNRGTAWRVSATCPSAWGEVRRLESPQLYSRRVAQLSQCND